MKPGVRKVSAAGRERRSTGTFRHKARPSLAGGLGAIRKKTTTTT